MSCSPSIEQFAIRQNATPFTTSSAFWAFSLREAFRFEMARAVRLLRLSLQLSEALTLRWRNPDPEANRLALVLLRGVSEQGEIWPTIIHVTTPVQLLSLGPR